LHSILEDVKINWKNYEQIVENAFNKAVNNYTTKHFVEKIKKECLMKNRKYLPTLSELIDRLSIAQLKEVFISDHREEYAQEISDIVHDIQLVLRGQ
jgi:hypothetical protein